jgi:PAS domain S-box-containing protein
MRKQLKQMIMLWSKLTTSGASEDLEAPLRKRIIVTNQVSLSLCALAVVFFFFWFSQGEHGLVLINGISAIVFYLLVRLNSKKHYYLSRFFLLITLNISMFVLVGGVGKVGEIQITFYFLPTLSFILFGSKEIKSRLFVIAMPIFLFIILMHFDFKMFDLSFTSGMAVNPYLFYYVNFGFIILSMFYLARETQKAENELSTANEKLLNSQIFLKSIIENLPLAFYTRDMENRYTLVNSEFEKLFNVNKGEVLLKTDSEIFSRSKVEFLVLFDNEVYKSQSSKIFEASIGPDGGSEQKTFLCTKFPILGPHRETFGICGIAQDISDRIEAQKRLDEQRALVLDKVKLLALTEMANGMSHEINNPLAILEMIHGKLARILTKGNYSEEVLQDTLNKMHSAMHRIGFIVSALRKFIERPIDERKESIDLTSLINEILALSKEKMIQSGIELSVKTSGLPFNIFGQSGEIRQVVYSLLSNSFDAVANSPKATVGISTDYFENFVRIIIQDSGPGVPKELMSKLFQPFFTTKDVGEGQGLSLSVAKGIINSHGGRIFYDPSSELTSFVIELPREEKLLIVQHD